MTLRLRGADGATRYVRLRFSPLGGIDVDGAGALQTVDQHVFDLVITDAVMPGMSGPQLVEHLRTARPELPVLLMSGYTPGEAQNSAASGVPRLRKPFTMPDLTRALGLVLDHDAVRQPVT